MSSSLVSKQLRTPRAAAIAGIAFSILLLAFFWPLRRSLPPDPTYPGTCLRTHAGSVALALNLVPFAGVAFLWFVGVLRDRLGDGKIASPRCSSAARCCFWQCCLHLRPFSERSC